MTNKPCSGCGQPFVKYNSLQRFCVPCLASRQKARKHKPMKKVGPVTKQLIEQRQEWTKNHPPDHQGYYTCYICKQAVHIDDMQLEHAKSKARHPELRFIESNLEPSCSSCNQKKGSKDSC